MGDCFRSSKRLVHRSLTQRYEEETDGTLASKPVNYGRHLEKTRGDTR